MGLLTYYQYTGNKAALEACRKMGDLLVATYPEKFSKMTGCCGGDILEPIVASSIATPATNAT